MVLVDTSVWISHLREKNPRLETLLEDAQVVSHDFVMGEMACGRLRNRDEVLTLLQALPRVSVVSQTELIHFIEKRSLAGRGLGFVDMHLLAAAQLMGVALWTLDRRLAEVTGDLKLAYQT